MAALLVISEVFANANQADSDPLNRRTRRAQTGQRTGNSPTGVFRTP